MTQEFEPLSADPTLLSEEKRTWWAGLWDKRGLKQPRLAVFQFAMNSTLRQTASNETIAWGYTNLNKFHDKEPEAVLTAIEKLDPTFFESYPRRTSTTYDLTFKKNVISEAARTFYHHGLAAYGKPKLRKQTDSNPVGTPLAAL